MKIVLPREHGSWGMLFAPLLVGAFSGGLQSDHLLLFPGMLAAFLASNPLLQWLKQPQRNAPMIKWAAGYGSAALLFGVPLLMRHPQLLWLALAVLVLLAVNISFALRKNERHLLNDAAAIAGLSLGAVAAYFLGDGAVSPAAWWIALSCLLLFFGSALHVKTLIRAKGSRAMKRAANLYHLALLLLPLLLWAAAPQLFDHPALSLAFAGSALRTWLVPFNASLKMMTVGILEIANTAYFVIVASIVFSI